MRARDAAAHFGVTYRQLDYWIACGWIRTPTQGTGHARDLSDDEVEVLAVMVRLVNVGFTPKAAAKHARRIHPYFPTDLNLGHGLVLVVTPEANP